MTYDVIVQLVMNVVPLGQLTLLITIRTGEQEIESKSTTAP